MPHCASGHVKSAVQTRLDKQKIDKNPNQPHPIVEVTVCSEYHHSALLTNNLYLEVEIPGDNMILHKVKVVNKMRMTQALNAN